MLQESHELVKYLQNTPLNIFIHSLGYVSRHWHESLELIMVLEGTIEVTSADQHYILHSDDIILINSNTTHEIHSEGTITTTLLIDLSKYDKLGIDIDNMIFDCNTVTNKRPELFNGIRYAIANMIKENAQNTKGSNFKLHSLSYYLLGELVTHFQGKSHESGISRRKHIDRMTRIINYINEHYAENFSLSDLAEAEGLSVPYLSNFFDKYMGTKFSQYYTSVKLEHAMEDMMNTSDSIEAIAMRNGFTESHAFVRAFKKKYEMLPSVWRRDKREMDLHHAAPNLNYLLVEPSNYLHLLTKYLVDTDGFISAPVTPDLEIREVDEINMTMPAQPLKHHFKKFTAIGRASDLLNKDIQEMLKDLQKNIGFSYIKFHGLLSDDMMVVSRSTDEKLHFHYMMIDMALDFLMSINLKPMIQLSFMPIELASDRSKQIFCFPVNTSPPKDMAEWNMLIKDFTLHLLERYGENEVLQWPFCVWNEPMTPTAMFGFENDKTFYVFYQNTYNTVKQIHKDIRFGSPSLLYMENLANDTWTRNFLAWTKKNHCFPEFINFHYYSDILPGTSTIIGTSPSSTFPRRSDDFSLWIGSMNKILNECGAGHLPKYLTEWNFTLSHRNLINDTCFKSCYMMKNLLRNYDRLDSFGYWSLTDLLSENALPDNLFHGGLGMYTMNGLRKSVFYTFYFANMLGDELLANGEGYFVTRKKDSYQIITYHYIHYGDLFASGELFDITETRRYSPFDMSNKLQLEIPLVKLENGIYEIREYYVNRDYGSAYDIWLKLGGMPLDAHDTDLLRNLCVPGYHKERRLVEKEQFSYTPILEPLEIRFTEIKHVGR